MNKIAIVHDTFIRPGGAERVFVKLIQIYPHADIYISLINKENIKKLHKITKGRIYYSGLSRYKFVLDFPEYYKPLILLYWRTINLDKYDLVISSSHSFSSNWVRVKNEHISYIHTPPRYLYGVYNEMQFINKPPVRQFLSPLFSFIRKLDYRYVNKIPLIIANSKNVQERIWKFYKRKAVVIYPPVKTEVINDQEIDITKRRYYLFLSRLVKQKGVYLCVRTFNKNKKQLVIVGEGKVGRHLRKMAGKNIRFMGYQSDNKIPSILRRAKALVYCSIEEDFGMVPVEAMSYGIPVIAYKSGGVKETVIDGKTGVFFHKYNISALNRAITKFESRYFSSYYCIRQARNFNEKIFEMKIKQQVDRLLESHQ